MTSQCNEVFDVIAHTFVIMDINFQKDLASVVIVEDDKLRSSLSGEDDVTTVIKCGDVTQQTKTTSEQNLLDLVAVCLPTIETIDVERLKVGIKLNNNNIQELYWSQ